MLGYVLPCGATHYAQCFVLLIPFLLVNYLFKPMDFILFSQSKAVIYWSFLHSGSKHVPEQTFEA